MTLFMNPSNIQGQDTILNIPTYTIKFDTITRIDTTYIIDTIINTYTYVVRDTIYAQDKDESDNDFLLYYKFDGDVGITLNQLAITHWAAGGESNGSGKYRQDSHIITTGNYSIMLLTAFLLTECQTIPKTSVTKKAKTDANYP